MVERLYKAIFKLICKRTGESWYDTDKHVDISKEEAERHFRKFENSQCELITVELA